MENEQKLKGIDINDFDKIRKWSYSLASEWAIKFLVPEGVTSARRYEAYKQDGGYLPKYFPRIVDDYFKRRNTWKGWNDFFGNLSNLEKGHYVSYEKAKQLTARAKIRHANEFLKWKNRPACIPAQPKLHYDEWTSWEDFLGENYYKGGFVPGAKLTEKDVKIIKHQLALGVPAAVLARMFNVSDMQIIRIKRGENWAHVKL